MKKMTKSLSLVLALAMVLGMTAFADAPTKIILFDDFSDATVDGVTSKNNLVANRGSMTKAGATSYAGFGFTGVEDNTKFIKLESTGTTVEEVDGKVVVKSMKRANNDNTIAYLLSEPWDRVENTGKSLAVMAKLTPLDSLTTDYDVMVALFNQKIADETNTEGDYAGFQVDENGNLVFEDVADNRAIDFGLNQWSAHGNEHIADIEVGVEHEVGFSVNPTNIYGAAASSFSVFSIANHTQHYSQGMKAFSNTEQFKGFAINLSRDVSVMVSEVKIFEVSRTPADFYIENTENTNVPVDSDFVVKFSQPFIQKYYPNRFKSNGEWTGVTDYLATNFVVAKGEEVLTYGEDYTIDLTTAVEGTEVKGIVTIKLAGDKKYGETYTVTAKKGLKTYAAGVSSASDYTATFTTEAAPSYSIALTASEGLAAGGAAVTADTMAGKTVYFTANATNTTGRALNGTLAIGIYDANGNLVKIAAANKAFDVEGTNSFSAAFKIADGQTAKAFVKGTASEIAFQ